MIESEEKRKRLTEDIEHWCDHVKATPFLRRGDIQGLVHTILTEFYHEIYSCGHMGNNDGVAIAFRDFIVDRGDMDDGGDICEVQGIYCKDCAEKYKKELGAWEIATIKEAHNG